MITSAERLKTLAQQPRASERPEPSRTPAPPSAWDNLQDSFLAEHAVPNMIYPSISGATPAERALIMATLDSLPLRDVATAATVHVAETLGDRNLLGLTRIGIGTISLNRTGWGMENPDDFRYTLVHELGHTVDTPDRMPQVLAGRSSSSAPFGQGPFVTDYASTAPAEDFAESYAHQRLDPQRLQQVSPEKMKALEQLDRPRGLEALLEQPAFRESGRTLGQALEAVPYLRHGAEFLGSLAMMNTALNGAVELVQGTAAGDGRRALTGLLRTGAAASIAMTSQHPAMGPVGLALLAADQGLQKATAAGAGKGTTAAAMVAASAGGVVGGLGLPVGLTWAGYQAAGPVGGAVGLVLGSFLGHRLGASAGANLVLALADDGKLQAVPARAEENKPAAD